MIAAKDQYNQNGIVLRVRKQSRQFQHKKNKTCKLVAKIVQQVLTHISEQEILLDKKLVALQKKRKEKSMKENLFLVLAGGRGETLAPLTDDCPKPLVRFGFSSRIIDFMLNNCLIFDGNEIILLTQHFSGSLGIP